ncbi:MAG: N-acetylglucosamine-6-phosphate deacetylase [Lachnospiraceae bacterium]|nr:N-acetylglucosamine-6-phosphate deacetylase [Lachnospiraceae bacterium]
MAMILKNARIFLAGKGFVPGGLCIEQDRIAELFIDREMPKEGEDLQGDLILPGLIDMHIHGCLGQDCSDADAAGLDKIASFLAGRGITSFAPTTMTLPHEELLKALSVIAEAAVSLPPGRARIAGIHMEGPYLSVEKKGAHKEAYLRLPDEVEFSVLQKAAGGRIRIIDVAPELPGAEEFIRKVSKDTAVSIAHTCAGHATASAAFSAGARHVTHLFNAMPPMLHREPGVIGAAAERMDVTAELICDGFHVHPAAVRAAFHLFPHRICMISDAIRCMGMPDGGYVCGGQEVILKDGEARLGDGTIAGSVTDLYEAMCRAIRFGVPAEEAVEAASITPAAVLGIAGQTGSIEEGKLADLIVCDQDYHRKRVILGGREVTGKQGVRA